MLLDGRGIDGWGRAGPQFEKADTSEATACLATLSTG